MRAACGSARLRDPFVRDVNFALGKASRLRDAVPNNPDELWRLLESIVRSVPVKHFEKTQEVGLHEHPNLVVLKQSSIARRQA